MYIVTKVDTGKVVAVSSYPNFVRIDEFSNNIYGADEYSANGIKIDDIVYAIKDRLVSDKYEYVTVISKEPIELAIETAQNEIKSTAYIDYLSAMTGIDLPDEEEV